MRLGSSAQIVLLASALVLSCHAKDEARVLVSAVDAYRAASNDDKPARADALDKVACSDEQVCEVKAACTKSADATAKGLRLQHEVQVAPKDQGNKQNDALAEKWKEASSDIDEGFARLDECRTKVAALRERFGI
jgi:hypothetical protein